MAATRNTNARNYALIALGVLALACVGRTVIESVRLSHDQDVPPGPAWFELAAFIGAALIPLVHALRRGRRKNVWLLALWTPCILYVVGIGINLLVRSDVDGRFVFAVIRLAGWLAIAVLFLREPDPSKEA